MGRGVAQPGLARDALGAKVSWQRSQMYCTYILYSERLARYYVGSTEDLGKRLAEHNRGKGKFVQRGVPWVLVKYFERTSRSEAIRLEDKIKKRGIERFLRHVE
jgi:putative endonuclease